MWKPFNFEIMVLVGQAYGTKDAVFRDLFNSKAYLMNKKLTVESRLTSLDNSRQPLSVALYYTESAYQKLLSSLIHLLLKHNEPEFLSTFLNDQARVYLTRYLVYESLE